VVDFTPKQILEALMEAAREQVARERRTDAMSISEIARECGWDRRKAARVVKTGEQNGRIERFGSKHILPFDLMSMAWRLRNKLI